MPHVDWSIPATFIIVLAAQLVGAVFALLKMSSSIQRSIDAKFAGFELSMNTFREGDIRELKARVKAQEDWVKTLRERSHDLGDIINAMILRVDRLERPHANDN